MENITGRLTRFDHDEIIAAYNAGISVNQLAGEYQRKETTIREIIRRGPQVQSEPKNQA